eukprot:1143896-Pelagomonas_calceolata.AAC.1
MPYPPRSELLPPSHRTSCYLHALTSLEWPQLQRLHELAEPVPRSCASASQIPCWCPQARAAFHPAPTKRPLHLKSRTGEITYTDGSVIRHKDESPPFVGSGVYKPSRYTAQSSEQLQLHIHPDGHGPTNTINRAELAGILVALQQGHTAIASDSASCLSQISKQIFNPMRMRTHLHAGLIQAISNVLEHSPHPLHFYKVKEHSGIIGNEGADACARAATLTDTTDFALPDARDPFHNFYWLRLKSSHGRNGDPHHSHTAPIHYLKNLTDKLTAYMHKRHKLGSADTSGYHLNSWQRLTIPYGPLP